MYLARLRHLLLNDAVRFRNALRDRNGWNPREVEIRLTWTCDADCVMCGLRSYAGRGQPGFARALPRLRLFRILSEIAEMGGESILYSGGEVTLLGDFIHIIERTSSLGLFPYINTHGGNLRPSYCDALVGAGLHGITVSLDAPDAEVHDRIRGRSGTFQVATNGLKHMAKYGGGNPKPHLLINTVIMSLNYQFLPQMVVLAADCGADEINFSPLSIDNPWDDWATGRVELKLSRRAEEELESEIFPNVLALAKKHGVRATIPADVDSRGNVQVARGFFWSHPTMCSVVFYHAVVNVNGDVVPCCYSSSRRYLVGNVHTQSFASVWQGQRFKAFREGCFPAVYPMCRSCSQHRNENELLERWYTRSTA